MLSFFTHKSALVYKIPFTCIPHSYAFYILDLMTFVHKAILFLKYSLNVTNMFYNLNRVTIKVVTKSIIYFSKIICIFDI